MAFAGYDFAKGEIHIGSRRWSMPEGRLARMAIGGALILGGILGFLPVLGFWMLPLGILVLSHDIAFIRRFRRRMIVKWQRRKQNGNGNGKGNGKADV